MLQLENKDNVRALLKSPVTSIRHGYETSLHMSGGAMVRTNSATEDGTGLGMTASTCMHSGHGRISQSKSPRSKSCMSYFPAILSTKAIVCF